MTRSARAVEQVVNELNMKQNEADVYRLREQVNNYYFSVLLVSSQIDVTGILISDLDGKDQRSLLRRHQWRRYPCYS